MFGSLGVSKGCLADAERELYQAHFCGLCHAMAEYGGRASSLLTNYDMTFWLIVLGALEPPAPVERKPCTAWPWRRMPVLALSPQARSAAASLNLALVAAKLEDDRADGEGYLRRLAFRALAAPAARARPWLERHQFPQAALRDLASRQAELEAQRPPDFQALAEPSARLLEEVFGWQAHLTRRPELEATLRRLGRAVGRYLYWWDAWQDRERDRRAGRFNAVLACQVPQASLHHLLEVELAALETALNELPLGPRAGLAEAQVGTLQARLARAFGRALRTSPGIRRRLARAGLVRVQDCDCGGGDCGGCDGCGDCGQCGDCSHCCHAPDCSGCPDCADLDCCCDSCECCSDCNWRGPDKRDWCPICCCFAASKDPSRDPQQPGPGRRRRKRPGKTDESETNRLPEGSAANDTVRPDARGSGADDAENRDAFNDHG